jgi:hypothetical protein
MAETRASRSERAWWRRPGCILGVAVPIVLLVGGLWLYFSLYQGRELSRYTGVPVKVDLPECIASRDQIISISFHKETSGETIKDVTYECDGRIFSQEYNDFGILQGSVEWTFKR